MLDPSLRFTVEVLRDVCVRYDVAELSVFGSAVKGTLGPESDVDFLVEFRLGVSVSFDHFMNLQEELAKMTGRRVDLARRSALKPLIRHEILESRQVVYAA